MTSFLPGRRRAEQFAQVVEGTRTTRDPRVTQLLEVVDHVRRPAAIEPSEQFRTDLRQQLIAEAAAIQRTAGDPAASDAALTRNDTNARDNADVPSGSGNQHGHGPGHRAAGARRLPPRPRTRVLAATTVITLVAGTFGVVSFAREAMPGETLYGLKRSLEETQAVIATNSESRGRHYLASGQARLSELSSLINSERAAGEPDRTSTPEDRNRTEPIDEQQQTNEGTEPEPRTERPDIDPDRVALARSTLQDFAHQTEQGGNLLLEAYQNEHRETSLERLQQFTEESGRELAALAPDLPEELGDSFTEATRVLYELDERIGAFCADCVSLSPEPDQPTPSPTPSEPETPSPSPTSPSPAPTTPNDEQPSPDPTDKVSPQPENPSPIPRLPDEDEQQDEDDNPFPLPTELPFPLF